jgi:HAD superfamily hydrolase (TIGR01549 family)
MSSQIEAVLFDMGGTLRRSVQTDAVEKRRRFGQILNLIGSDLTVDEFIQLLTDRSKAYKKWAEETELEASETQLWTDWLLPDFPADQIAQLAGQLNQLWRSANGQILVRPETKEVILTLFRRGYRLGLVSNTTSSLEAPQILNDLQIAGCFETMVLSCMVGIRKPNPEILLAAARQMDIQPDRCAYVGDLPYRDVKAAYHAGFAHSIIISDTLEMTTVSDEPSLKPNEIIRDLRELLPLFPGREEASPSIHPGGNGRMKCETPSPVYDISISTMWGINNFPGLADFFCMAERMGFAAIELNHQVNSEMLAGIDLTRYRFSSVHEPCPADISARTQKTQDWLVSSLDEEKRKAGVDAVRKSIRMAKELGASAVVIHAGMVKGKLSDEKVMYDLFNSGRFDSPEYRAIKQMLMDRRSGAVRMHLEAVKKSLLELLEEAGPLGIRLGLENRYHYAEIPAPDELEELLSLAGPDQLGFWYDVGHAQVLDRLGFYAHEDWLRRFGDRIVGVHLQDAKGILDHQAPGYGDVDFSFVARYIPADAIRTLEVKPNTRPEQVRNGLKFLVEKGILQCHL